MPPIQKHAFPNQVSDIFSGITFYIESNKDNHYRGLHKLMELIRTNGGRLFSDPAHRFVSHILVFRNDPPYHVVDLGDYTETHRKTFAELVAGPTWTQEDLVNQFSRRAGAEKGPRAGKVVLMAGWITLCVEAGRQRREDDYLGYEVRLKSPPIRMTPAAPSAASLTPAPRLPPPLPPTATANKRSPRRWPAPPLPSTSESTVAGPSSRSVASAQNAVAGPSRSVDTWLPPPSTDDPRPPRHSNEYGRRRSPERLGRDYDCSPPLERRSLSSRRDDDSSRMDSYLPVDRPADRRERSARKSDRVPEYGESPSWDRRGDPGAMSPYRPRRTSFSPPFRPRDVYEPVQTSTDDGQRDPRRSTNPPPPPSHRLDGPPSSYVLTTSTPFWTPGQQDSRRWGFSLRQQPHQSSSLLPAESEVEQTMSTSHPVRTEAPAGVAPVASSGVATTPIPGLRSTSSRAQPVQSVPPPVLSRWTPQPKKESVVPAQPTQDARAEVGMGSQVRPVAVDSGARPAQGAAGVQPSPRQSPALQRPAAERLPTGLVQAATAPGSFAAARMLTAGPTVLQSEKGSTPSSRKPPASQAPAAPPSTKALSSSQQRTAPRLPGARGQAPPPPPPSAIRTVLKQEESPELTPPPPSRAPSVSRAVPENQREAKSSPPPIAIKSKLISIPSNIKRKASASHAQGEASTKVAGPSGSTKPAVVNRPPAARMSMGGSRESSVIVIDDSDAEDGTGTGASASAVARAAKAEAKRDTVTSARPKERPILPNPAAPGPDRPSGDGIRPSISAGASARRPPLKSSKSSSSFTAAAAAGKPAPAPIPKRKRDDTTPNSVKQDISSEDETPLSAKRKRSYHDLEQELPKVAIRERQLSNRIVTSPPPPSKRSRSPGPASAPPAAARRYPDSPAISQSAEDGPSQFFVNQSGLPMTFHVVLDEAELMEPLKHLITVYGGRLVDIAMADLIILPFKAGTLSSSSLPAILDSDSLRACHARPLISHQYISNCVQQKAQLHIKAYRIDLAAPSAGSSDDRGAGSKSWRTSESYAADLCTPESMTDRHPKVEDRPSSNGGREWNQAAAGRSWEVERKGEEVIRVSPSDDDLEEGSEYGEEDELDSEADVSVPLKSEVKSSLSNPPTSDSAKPASARPPKVRQLSTVRPEDEADYIWLKSRIKAWDFLGSRTRFLESLNTIKPHRTWGYFLQRYQVMYEAEMPKLLHKARVHARRPRGRG